MNPDIFGWIGNVFIVLGSFLITKKRIEVFYSHIIGNLFYAILGFMTKTYSIIGLTVILISISLYGIYNWRKQNV